MTDEAETQIRVKVRPRAPRTELRGIAADGTLDIRLKAAPVDGAANQELLRFLGRKLLGVAPSSLRVVRGATSRDKTVGVTGLTAEEVAARLRRE